MMIIVGVAAYYPPIYPIDGLDIYLVVNHQLSTGSTTAPQLVKFAKLYVDLAQLNCPETNKHSGKRTEPAKTRIILVFSKVVI